ncbi:MAG: hypothetical protein CMN10_15060 [Roseobacter sp.]|nr:hypothetical protein [Roseobacter sp.]MBV49874.1 hypothetical protein [Roseobacter sp.]
MDDFYAARDNTMPSLPWPSIAPPFTAKAGKFSEALSSLKLIREPYKLTESLLDVAAEMN